jgi:hypothetical protein
MMEIGYVMRFAASYRPNQYPLSGKELHSYLSASTGFIFDAL